MVTVRAVAVTGDLSANVSSKGFTLAIFYPQKAGVTLAAPVPAPQAVQEAQKQLGPGESV